MVFEYTQPKTEEDIKCDNDCMVRAVTNITKEEYSKVHKLMYGHGWRATRRRSKDKWEDQITKTLDDLGFEWERISFPAVKGEDRMKATTLSKIDPDGKYIIRVAKHVSALDEGVLLDTWNCSYKCVYFAWKIKKK
jgi:hypothetical protein